MKALQIGSTAVFLSVIVAADASALPLDAPPPVAAPQVTPVVNGYGPLPYGLYGRRRPRRGVSYGTGYHGRGTRTGGPVGGLPNRN